MGSRPVFAGGRPAQTFDPSGGLWAARRARGSTTGNPPGLYSINPSTGAATFLRAIVDSLGNPPSGGVVSLQFRCDGVLFGGTANAISPATDGGRLITINSATGVFSFVGGVAAVTRSLAALAFQSPCVSSPSHSYDLTSSFADSLGEPSLVSLGGTLIPGTGYVFAANQGLNRSGALANPANYSIQLRFKLDATTGFRKLIDFLPWPSYHRHCFCPPPIRNGSLMFSHTEQEHPVIG